MKPMTNTHQSSSFLDLDKLSSKEGYTITLKTGEDSAERDARIRRQDADAVHNRRKDMLLFCVALVSIISTLIFCFWAVIKGIPFPDKSAWITIIAIIITGLISYLVGKSNASR